MRAAMFTVCVEVAFLENHRTGVEANMSRRQALVGDGLDYSIAANTPGPRIGKAEHHSIP